ncbi:MFS transporter [Microlunatus sp. Gsoil 973]|nr:MFS transporter [Microlunatus sp. Gsoil 973]
MRHERTVTSTPVLRRRPFVAYAAAEAFSLGGTRLSMIAIPWLVLTTTGSPTMTGTVAMAEMLPYVISKFLAGPIVDRMGTKPIAVGADLISVLTISAIPVLHLLGALHIALLVPIVALMGTLRGPSDAAKGVLPPRVAEWSGAPLERVTGVQAAIERLASSAGAAGAGGLVALIGPASALAVNAGTFAVSAVIIAFGIPSAPSEDHPGDRVPDSRAGAYLADLRAGWTFLRTDTVLLGLAIMIAITNLLDQAFVVVMLPVWARNAGHGAGGVGLVLALFSGFSILGALIAAARGERLPRLIMYTVCFMIGGLPRFAIFAMDAPMPVIVISCAIGGFASGFINPIIGAVIFERIPRSLTGRVTSLVGATAWSLMPFGGLLGGLLVTGFGLPLALLAVGAVYLVATLSPVVMPSFGGLGARPEDRTDQVDDHRAEDGDPGGERHPEFGAADVTDQRQPVGLAEVDAGHRVHAQREDHAPPGGVVGERDPMGDVPPPAGRQ